MNLLVTICARGGSKGIPGKNIRQLGGRPLIAYSIEIGRRFAGKFDGTIALSTDSEEIKNVAEVAGLSTDYLRPEEFATDHAGKLEVIRDLLFYEEKRLNTRFDYILDLDVTSPMRTLEDLEKAFSDFLSNENALNLFSVNPAARNPYFNMVEEQENGFYGLVKKGHFLTRQSAPKVYDLNASFYFYRRKFFDQKEMKTINDHSLIYVMPHICFDLDHPVDFEFMEFLVTTGKLDFFSN